jgi:hypothetical protein
MWPPFCLTTSCKRTVAFVTTFRHKSSEIAGYNFTMCAMSCATFSGLFWHTLTFAESPEKEIAWINIRAMRRPQFATLMTFRKPMWRHTKIKRIIQEIKNHVCSEWTGSACMNHCVCIVWPVAKRGGMKLFINMSLYRSLMTVLWKKKLTDDS